MFAATPEELGTLLRAPVRLTVGETLIDIEAAVLYTQSPLLVP